MSKEIIITDACNQGKFICFKLNGLEDGILVGIPDIPNCITVCYKGETKVVPLDAKTEDLEELNSDENVVKPSCLKESDKITTTLTMDKETYDWLTTPSEEDDDVGYWQPNQVTELDDEAFEAFEKEVMNPEPNMEKVEAAKKIFEDVDKVINDIKIVKIVETPVNAKTYPLKNQEIWMHEPVVLQNPEYFWKHERTHYGEPHLLELMDEWGVDETNYADFRSVIQEHCFDKGLYAFDDIEKAWKEHQESIKNTVEGIKKNGNN